MSRLAHIVFTLSELESEKWRDIPGYEGIYQASSLGRIRTKPGKTTHSVRHGVRVWKTRILKPKLLNDFTGYRVSLWKNKRVKDWLVARLVCMTWHGATDDGMTVNHINGNRWDNRAWNLEWLTRADNIRHAFEMELMPTQKPVQLEDASGNRIRFRSMSAAGKYLGRSDGYISGRIKNGKMDADGHRIIV